MESIPRAKPKPGRPKGARGTPRRCDLETLMWLYDLRGDDADAGFKQVAFDTLKDFVATPGISMDPHPGVILLHAERTTHTKRLRRLAARFPRRNDLFVALYPEWKASAVTACVVVAADGCLLPVPPLPAAALCEGTED